MTSSACRAATWQLPSQLPVLCLLLTWSPPQRVSVLRTLYAGQMWAAAAQAALPGECWAADRLWPADCCLVWGCQPTSHGFQALQMAVWCMCGPDTGRCPDTLLRPDQLNHKASLGYRKPSADVPFLCSAGGAWISHQAHNPACHDPHLSSCWRQGAGAHSPGGVHWPCSTEPAPRMTAHPVGVPGVYQASTVLMAC